MRSVRKQLSLPKLRGGLTALILLALVLFPFGGVHLHEAPSAVAGGLSAEHALSHTLDHAHERDGAHSHQHDTSDGEDALNEVAGAECCMVHCMPLASLKYEPFPESRFVACFAAESMIALCSSLSEKPRKPPRSTLS